MAGDRTIIFQKTNEVKLVAEIVKETITEIYPRYYPAGAVQYFLNLHSEERIMAAVTSEEIYLLAVDGIVVGTGSIRGNEIRRVFVRPSYQGNGYGSSLMDHLEAVIYENYSIVHLDASFPAEHMYIKRGYRISTYEKIETRNGDYLCYHTMEKAKTGSAALLEYRIS